MNKNKNLAFTLAEVLIVIGIIGVVAALTLPNLNHATGDKEKVTRVKKIYSALTEAFDRAQAIYGPFDTWFKDIDCNNNETACSERFAKRVTEFMKVSKDCGFGDGCYSIAPLLYVDGNKKENNYLESLQRFNAYMVTLSDGMSLRFNYIGGKIGADIDGPQKGKNQIGKDIFDFTIFTNEENATSAGAKVNQIYPSSSPNLFTGDYSDLDPGSDYSTAWVIENGNLDYLKCPDELNWETKTSCK